MIKRTKSCEIRIHLKSGECLRGRYHVDSNTSSSVRPSDALRESASPYLLLTDTRSASGADARHGVVLVRAEAIAYIQLPDENWA